MTIVEGLGFGPLLGVFLTCRHEREMIRKKRPDGVRSRHHPSNRDMTGSRLDRPLIEDAVTYLSPLLVPTPVEDSPALSRILGVPVILKLEFMQPTGSFKVRGALFRLSRLTSEERARGVVTCSAGNHGLGMAHGASQLNVPLTVYVPASIDPVKLDGMLSLGAEVVRSPFPGYDETAEWARRQPATDTSTWISAFDDFAIMAGNGGTLAAEILQQVSAPAAVVLPVGGGGMAAGAGYVLKETRPSPQLIACQHVLSPGLALSLESGEAVTRLPAIETVARGVEGGMGSLCFSVLESRVDQVALVSEQEIMSAMLWMLREHRYLVEPSAAVAVAACLEKRFIPPGGPLVLILSGRNVAPAVVKKVLCHESD
ncbi:MAG: pyridoxal-phosphate dependent enzyme [Acidobacteriota bacterium]|nr:pyridoxal-phosphate dependent enzyme [Acidobacteriota bacterium]